MILDEIGQRKDDSGQGHHADVVPAGEYACIFHHCNPDGRVVCNRDEPFPFVLRNDGIIKYSD